ncbi:MAG: type II toxin-antitoxin system RelE/ParE family toxin [Oscillospiraceae bacterium]|nr:type II toxin-antitoxin system RelE/ParE family toxin [Oscillospiraceae bacterium]MCD8374299.1 type II toxin-antitoxin system RelE/ParE family toxin [Oscillospiraceae bacterium]
MTRYTIKIEKQAEKFITKLPKPEKARVLQAIYKLPHEGDIKRLTGKKSKGLLRLRVGDYRIIYSVDNGELTVLIIDAGNRGEIYNRY